jgi:hypothetical protein
MLEQNKQNRWLCNFLNCQHEQVIWHGRKTSYHMPGIDPRGHRISAMFCIGAYVEHEPLGPSWYGNCYHKDHTSKPDVVEHYESWVAPHIWTNDSAFAVSTACHLHEQHETAYMISVLYESCLSTSHPRQ